jgi:ComF family protein
MFTALKNIILNLIFPEACLGCQAAGSLLCTTCYQKLLVNVAPNLMTLRQTNLKAIFIAGDYDNPLLAKLIKQYKYSFLSRLDKILARVLVDFWESPVNALIYPDLARLQSQSHANIILMPIPLSPRRLRWRGFNQAELLARELSRQLHYQLDLSLRRSGEQPAQATLSESARLTNLNQVFHYQISVHSTSNRPDLTDKIIILIDDVTTTGTTLNEAAGVLRQSGAQTIYGLVLAKG